MFERPILAAVSLLFAAALPAGAQNSPNLDTEKIQGKDLQEWIKVLTDPDPSERLKAIYAIPQFGPAAEKAVPDLIRLAPPPPHGDKDAGVRCQAVITLAKIKIAEKDIPKVIECWGKCLSDPHSIVRYQAALGLKASGDHARGAVKELIAAAKIGQPTFEIKHELLIALQRAGHDTKNGPDIEVIKIFLEHLRHEAAQVRLQAALGLGALGRPANPIVLNEVELALLTKANDQRERNPGVRIWANASLMALEKVDDKMLKRISEFLKSNNVDVRSQAVRALGTVGEKAKSVVPTLIDMLDDKEKTVAAAATDSLLQINTDASTKAVINNLKNGDPEIRAYTAQAIGNYGEKMKDAIPAMIELLNDKDQKVSLAACYALYQMGSTDPRARQALVELKERKDTSEPLKKYAAECIKFMDGPPPIKKTDKGR